MTESTPASFRRGPTDLLPWWIWKGRPGGVTYPYGPLRELLLPGVRAWSQFHPEPGRKTAWTLIAVERDGVVVNLDSQAPNHVAADFIRSGRLGLVPDLMKAEQVFGDSRLDLYYEAGAVRGVRGGQGRHPQRRRRGSLPRRADGTGNQASLPR